MVIRSKDYVPYFYRNSRDYQAVLAILDLIVNVIKTNLDTLVNNLDPNKCSYTLLELLASYVGYDYDHKETYEANRMIISNYINMIKNRGSQVGIRMACALSFNAEDDIERVEELDMFDVKYMESENKIAIYVYVPTYLKKMRDLLEKVRPAGIPLEIIPSYDMKTHDILEVHDYFEPEQKPYDTTRRDVSEKSKVGFTEVTRSGEPHQ